MIGSLPRFTEEEILTVIQLAKKMNTDAHNAIQRTRTLSLRIVHDERQILAVSSSLVNHTGDTNDHSVTAKYHLYMPQIANMAAQ